MHLGPAFYATMAVAVVILGLSKGGFAGVGMASTPLVALVAGPVSAAGLILPILVVQDAIAVSMYRRTFSGEILARLVPGALAGIVLAYALASRVPEWAVEIVLGGVSFAFATRQLLHALAGTTVLPRRRRGEVVLGLLSGLGAGFTSTIANAGTPPFQFYVLPKQLPKETYIGTSVVFFACLNLFKLPAFAALGQLTAQNLETSAIFVPLAIASSWTGVKLARSVDARRFNIVITVILLLVSLALVVQGVTRWSGGA